MNLDNHNQILVSKNNRYGMIDIIRLILAFIILSHHIWGIYSPIIHDGNNLSPGYLAVEAFFMISGFFLVASATKENSTTCWKYTWRRIWDYLPLLVLTMLGTIVVFALTSTIFLKANTACLTCWWTWFMWILFLVGLPLFSLWKHWKGKFLPLALILGAGCYVALYFINPYIYHPIDRGYWLTTAALTFASDLLRGFGGMLLGGVIFYSSKYIAYKSSTSFIKFIITLIGILSSITAIYFMYAATKTVYDFLVTGMIFIVLFCVFTNKGFISERTILEPKLSKNMCRFAYVLYIQQWLVIHLVSDFAKQYPGLWMESWWLILYALLTYVFSILLTLLFMHLDKKIKEKIMVKCVKLNNI